MKRALGAWNGREKIPSEELVEKTTLAIRQITRLLSQKPAYERIELGRPTHERIDMTLQDRQISGLLL